MSREISADPDWQNVLREWTDVLQPVSLAVIENGLFYQDDETKELESTLRVSLREIDALPIQFFGAIGDLIALLKPEAALWLLPILLRFGSVSEDSIYARSVVNKLRQDIAGGASFLFRPS